MRYVIGFLVALNMIALLTDARAAETPPTAGCKGGCIAVIQQIDGKLANSFTMTCIESGERCYGEGLLTLFDETVSVAATGIFTHGGINIAFYTKAGNLNGRAIFFSLDQQGVSKAVDLTTSARSGSTAAYLKNRERSYSGQDTGSRLRLSAKIGIRPALLSLPL